mgnify:CR=1 FL=1
MKYDFVVLGGTGLQGRIVARDLMENKYSVLLCGRNKSRIDHILKKYKKSGFKYVDLKDVDSTADVIKESGANVVINCAEEDWDLNALRACVKAGVHNIDLGSEIPMTRDQFRMHGLLKSKELIHITGCGSVPGIGNVMLRHAAEKLDSIKEIDVGYAWTSNIKKFVVPFSIPTILNEFKSPATNVERGKVVRIIPMTTIKDYYDEYVGEEKLFSVRHPETYTFYHYFKDKGLETVRFYAEFPPHSFQKIMDIIELGLDSDQEKIIRGTKITPIEFMTEVLKDIKIPKGYKEKEDLWLTITGSVKGKKKIIKMNCIAPTLKGWEEAGCNIDTGMPASIMAQMVKTGIVKEKGVFAPEAVIPPQPFFKELKKRSMKVYENGQLIN